MGMLINEIKYIHLAFKNDLKKISLEDNVYFTLFDISINADSYDDLMTASIYKDKLACKRFKDRTDKFKYANILNEKYFVGCLKKWFKTFDTDSFRFFEEKEGNSSIFIEDEYMNFDDWWVQFEELRKLIDEQYEKCCKREEEDIGRDCDRLEELAYEDECYARGVDPIFGVPMSYPKNI